MPHQGLTVVAVTIDQFTSLRTGDSRFHNKKVYLVVSRAGRTNSLTLGPVIGCHDALPAPIASTAPSKGVLCTCNL